MQGICRTLIAWILVVVFSSASVFAQVDRAILYPGHDVRLNGNSIQTSSAVMSGDSIETGSDPAQLTGHDLIAQVEKSTTVQYGDVLLLSCGAVVVSSAGHAVQASDTRVTPIGTTAKFRVVNRDAKLTISVESGTVRVSSDETTTLSAGQSTERASEGCPVAAYLKPAPAAAGGRGKWIALVAGGGGAAAAAIIIDGRKPASPSGP
jgi:hypothetical protein